jgi:hypothetical protein
MILPAPATGLTYVLDFGLGKKRWVNIHDVLNGKVYWVSGDDPDRDGFAAYQAPVDKFQALAQRAIDQGARPYWRERDGGLTPIDLEPAPR